MVAHLSDTQADDSHTGLTMKTDKIISSTYIIAAYFFVANVSIHFT